MAPISVLVDTFALLGALCVVTSLVRPAGGAAPIALPDGPRPPLLGPGAALRWVPALPDGATNAWHDWFDPTRNPRFSMGYVPLIALLPCVALAAVAPAPAADAVTGGLLMGFLGLGAEVFFTAILNARGWATRGHSSPWYFPLYVLAGPFYWTFGPALQAMPLLLAALLTGIGFHVCEFFGMGALELLGRTVGRPPTSPSNQSYLSRSDNIWGLIRLKFFPAWMLMGTLFLLAWRAWS